MASSPAKDRPAPLLTRRRVLQGAGVISGVALLAACGSQAPRGAGSGSAGRSGSSPASGGSAPVTITDQRGKKINLPHPARRVVTLPMPAASILVAVDQGPQHLVGMQQASWAAMKDGVLGQFYPQALKIPHDVANNSFVPNVESVLALAPDLVIQWGDEGTGIIAPLENAGLRVAGLTYGTQQDVYTWLELFARALGKPARAIALKALMHDALVGMTTLGTSRKGPAPKILYFNRFKSGLKVAGNGTYNDFYIKLVGGTNPASGPGGAPGKGMVGVDQEQVLAWDPDIVLLGNFDAAMPQDVYGSRVWQGLSAVRTKRVYKVPLGGYRWDPPSHESPLMWRWLSMVAFPRTPPFDLRGTVRNDYALFYDHRPTDAQLDAILWMKANGASDHYQQFHA